jgi:HAD superfamily hydrolase (TIGR01509 family)
MIKAVVFDMDGVLIEAKEWHYEALNRALRLFGLEISRYDHLTTFDGLPTRRKLEILSTQYHLPGALHQFINEMKQRYTMELVNAHCKPRFNHEFALSRLKAKGYRLAVASNSIRHTIEVMMARAALDKYLEFTISNEDVARAKPDPEIYNLAIGRFGIAPSECLIIEDNDHGIRAAQAAGAHVLAVDDVNEVTLANIVRRIAECDVAAAAD